MINGVTVSTELKKKNPQQETMINCMFYKFDDLKSERINEMRNNLSRCNNKMIRKILHQNFQSNCHQFTSSRTYCI